MRRWFLSYHSPDHALAERLKTAIERKDAASRVFFAPTHLRAGGSWSAQLAQELAEANGFILLIGEAGIGKWQVPEYYEAHDRWVNAPTEFSLVVVLLEGQTAPGLPFLRQLHWIITPDPASEKDVARLFDAAAGGGSSPGDLWRHTSPYRGLEAMEEKNSDYFFGRSRETVEVLNGLSAPDRLPVLIGNSGVGKSSLAQAGVVAALKRQAWPGTARASNAWPAVFRDSRQWCFLSLKPGTDPVKALVETFLDTWQFAATDPARAERQSGWIRLLLDGNATLSDLVDATARRRLELDQAEPPGFFLYVDQGEELYVRAEERRRRRFSELIAQALPDPRLRTMMSLRSDFLGHLQNDTPLFKARQHIDVPPLGEEELREVVGRPAQLLGARFETEEIVDVITQRTAEDSVKNVGALPLLSYTLDDMWTQMVHRNDGRLRLPAQSFDLAGVLVNRANAFLAMHPGAENALRRVLTLRCATVREDGEPTRRRALRSEFSKEEWRLASELADYPNRLLVTVTPESGEIYAEVAHEAIFRRWDKLRNWMAAEREFLAWRSGLEAARRAWETEEKKEYALLMGVALAKAQNWRARRSDDLIAADHEFIDRSTTREAQTLRRTRRIQTLAYVLVGLVLVGLIGWINQSRLQDQWNWFLTLRPYAVAQIWPYVVPADRELQMKPGEAFRECTSSSVCPDMIVVPAGQFMMGSPDNEAGRAAWESPLHEVTIGKSFAVSKFEITFDEWDACVALGGCPEASDYGFGRGTRPVINVGWDDVQRYVAWLSKLTGKPYRLLSETEYEYAARAGANTAYYWGDAIGKNNADCNDCGSQWDGHETAPVSSFAPNGFGLYDMAGNVWQWVDDCWHDSYQGTPTDGSPWLANGDCTLRVVRAGSWYDAASSVRSASRYKGTVGGRIIYCGFRVARTLLTP